MRVDGLRIRPSSKRVGTSSVQLLSVTVEKSKLSLFIP